MIGSRVDWVPASIYLVTFLFLESLERLCLPRPHPEHCKPFSRLLRRRRGGIIISEMNPNWSEWYDSYHSCQSSFWFWSLSFGPLFQFFLHSSLFLFPNALEELDFQWLHLLSLLVLSRVPLTLCLLFQEFPYLFWLLPLIHLQVGWIDWFSLSFVLANKAGLRGYWFLNYLHISDLHQLLLLITFRIRVIFSLCFCIGWID